MGNIPFRTLVCVCFIGVFQLSETVPNGCGKPKDPCTDHSDCKPGKSACLKKKGDAFSRCHTCLCRNPNQCQMVNDIAKCICDPTVTGDYCECPLYTEPMRDCKDVLTHFPNSSSGIYTIQTKNTHTDVEVYCDMVTDGGGWTVFQRRVDGSLIFNKNFTTYENGFGDLGSNFWLGLKNIQDMTSDQQSQQLRFTLTDVNGDVKYRKYEHFYLSDGQDYRLRIGNGSGDEISSESESLILHKDMAFSTYDKDNDNSGGNCAEVAEAGWWFNNCFRVIFNGAYPRPGGSTYNSHGFQSGIIHYGLNKWVAFKKSTMMFR